MEKNNNTNNRIINVSNETRAYIDFLINIHNKDQENKSKKEKAPPISCKNEILGNELLQVYTAYTETNKKLPYNINILNLIHGNENTHSRILCSLLNYPGTDTDYPYPIALQFIDKFVNKKLANDIKEKLKKSTGEKLYIENEKERMDVSIFMYGINGIIIENKIEGAVDQKGQIKTYLQRMKNKGFEESYAIYLTWNSSKKVSDISLSVEEQKAMRESGHFIELNYEKDILEWLKEEVLPQCPYKEKQLISALEQYIDYLKERSEKDREINNAIYKAFKQAFKKEN